MADSDLVRTIADAQRLAISRLDSLKRKAERDGDNEAWHAEADKVLLDFINQIGCWSLVKTYQRDDKHFYCA